MVEGLDMTKSRIKPLTPYQVMLGATKLHCSKKRSCGCAEEDIWVGKRIITPTFKNCGNESKRYKRYRKEY